MVIAHAWRKKRRLYEGLMMGVVQVVGPGQIVDGKLFDVRWDFWRNWNLLCVIFRRMKLKTFAS